ncbi:hypothetical protein Tco_1135596 [Tanacetum coccineum]
MPLRKAPRTRTTPATITNTTSITNAQLQAMIDQGVTADLAARDANRSMNGEDSHNSGMGIRRTERVARECTYKDFMKSSFPLTDLRKKMTDKYCPRNEMKTLEAELWNLKVKGTNVIGYNQRFQELALLCVRMFPEESDKIESTFAERQAENKRKLDYNNQAQQQPPKKQGVAIAYTAGSGERKEYIGTLPLCNKCTFHHNGQCTVKCANCKRVGHLTQDYRSPAATNNQRNLTCYECGNQGHYMSDCPELKNQNHGNQAGGMAHAFEGGETNQDLNDMEDDINA